LTVRSRDRATAAADEGYFPEGSILRRLHSERAVGLFYGQRALAIGAINPRAFVGTWEHTGARELPFQRLSHTAKAFERIFFGTRAEADGVLAAVRRLHEAVRGTLPADAGITPAGTTYSAFDPELMLWTVAVAADSARTFYELLVRALSEDERDALWSEYVRFGELFGMPREAAPRSHREFQRWFDAQISSPAAHLTPIAKRVGYMTAFEIPLPGIYAAATQVHNLIMLGSLPPRIRELYGLRLSTAQGATFRAAVAALRRSRPLVPAVVRRGSNVDAYDLVAKTELQRTKRGREPAVATA
jgi:uncharacterized protein (DUF2236 family)